MALPTAAAAALFLVLPESPSRTDFCVVDTAATTFSPPAANPCAYRCWPVRCTARRATSSFLMCMRVLLARRRRAVLFSTMVLPKPERPLGLLGFLQGDFFAGVAHALALVGLRRTERADLRGDLADALLVGALDQDLGLGRHRDGDAFRGLEHDRVREAERQVEVLAGERGAIADTDQLQLLLVALADALHHVVEKRARGTRGAAVLALDGALDLAALDLDLDAVHAGELQRALRALDGHGIG